MKKTTFKNISIILICLFFICACTSPSQPQDIAKDFTHAFKDLDVTKINQYLEIPLGEDIDKKINSFKIDTQESELLAIASSILMDFTADYKIETLSDTRATLIVTFNINNLKKIKEDHLELFIDAFTDIGNPPLYQKRLAHTYLESSKKSARSVIKSCQYELTLIDNEWKIVNGDSILKSLIKFFINPVYTVIQ